MKKILLIALILPFSIIAQDKFTYDKNGLSDYVVIEMEGKTQQEVYDIALKWVKSTFVNEDSSIQSQIDGELIRFKGFKPRAVGFKVLGSKSMFDASYMVDLKFKDGKIKFDPLSIEVITRGNAYVSPARTEYINSHSNMWKRNGKLRKSMQFVPDDISLMFNVLAHTLKNYENGVSAEKDDW